MIIIWLFKDYMITMSNAWNPWRWGIIIVIIIGLYDHNVRTIWSLYDVTLLLPNGRIIWSQCEDYVITMSNAWDTWRWEWSGIQLGTQSAFLPSSSCMVLYNPTILQPYPLYIVHATHYYGTQYTIWYTIYNHVLFNPTYNILCMAPRVASCPGAAKPSFLPSTANGSQRHWDPPSSHIAFPLWFAWLF